MPLHPINVMMVNDSLAMGGAERVAVDIANSLDPETHHVRFCSTRTGGPLAEELRPDIELHVLGRTKTWDLIQLARFARLVRETEIDIIHSHGRGTMRFVALAKALGLISVPHVFHDHFGWLHLDQSAGLGLRVPLQHSVDAYLGVDSRLCRWACDVAGVDPQRAFLVRSGVNLERFVDAEPLDLRAQIGARDDQVVITMVANFRPQKDHPTLFRALAALPDEVRDLLRIAVVGSTTADADYYQGCLGMVEQLGIADNISILGPTDEAPRLLAGADAAVMSSKNETGPLVILEYMASGLPFVATDTGEITAAVRDLDVGLIAPPRDHHELSRALASLAAMTVAERRTMGERGRAVVAERFDQQVVTRSIEQIYEQLLGLRAPIDASDPPWAQAAEGAPAPAVPAAD